MPKVKIAEVGRGIDGEYEIDLGRFTNAELRLIKRESGVRAGEIEEAFRAMDNDLLVCFGIIALQRAGRLVDQEALWEADAGNISLDLSDLEEDDDSPPAQEPASNASESGPIASSSQSSSDSGEPDPAN